MSFSFKLKPKQRKFKIIKYLTDVLLYCDESEVELWAVAPAAVFPVARNDGQKFTWKQEETLREKKFLEGLRVKWSKGFAFVIANLLSDIPITQ